MALDRTWYNTLVQDDGSNTVGTNWGKPQVDALMDDIDVALAALDAADAARPGLPGTSAPTTTGTQTALAIPAGTGDLVLYLNNASLLTVQGIAAGTAGQRLTVFSKGAGQVDFAHLHASGTALGKLKLVATTGFTSLAAGSGVAVFQYDATGGVTQWRLVAHEQGAWITVAYAGGNFTGAASMTWTVDSGDVGTMAYWLKGRTLSVMWSLNTTTIGGTPATSVLIGNGAYGGFTWARTAITVIIMADNGTSSLAATAVTMCQITAAGVSIAVFKQGGVNFTAGTNNVQTHGELYGEVQ